MVDTSERKEKIDLQLYGIRWWIAILIAVESMILRIIKNSFGLVNDVFAAYFEVSTSMVDWFTLIQIPGLMFSGIFLAPTLFYNLMTFRKLMITMAASLAFACASLVAAFAYPTFYPLIFVGELVVGFVVVAMDVASASFAIAWFPEHQVGLALSIKGISGNTGSLLAYVIPSNLLSSPPSNYSAIEAGNYSSHVLGHSAWFAQNQQRLIIYSSVFFLTAFIVLLFFILFVSDKPPRPPTIAQASVRARRSCIEKSRVADIVANVRDFYAECKAVLVNKVVVQVAVIFSFTQGCNFIQKLFMGEILRKIFLELGHTEKANAMSGYVLILFEAGCIIGSIVSGKVVDYCKSYHVLVSIALLCCFLSTIGIFVGYYFLNIIVLFISNTLFGFFITFLVTPIFETVYQHMYPIDTGFVTLILRIECSVGIIGIGQSCRLLLNAFGGIAVLAYASVILLSALVISLFLKPQYKRLDTEEYLKLMDEVEIDEKTPLIKF